MIDAVKLVALRVDAQVCHRCQVEDLFLLSDRVARPDSRVRKHLSGRLRQGSGHLKHSPLERDRLQLASYLQELKGLE